MKHEYIIINKTNLLKRIEELKLTQSRIDRKYDYQEWDEFQKRIDILEEIISQSTPLIPEIEKGVRQGLSICLAKEDWAYGISGTAKQDVNDYISNLKLNI